LRGVAREIIVREKKFSSRRYFSGSFFYAPHLVRRLFAALLIFMRRRDWRPDFANGLTAIAALHHAPFRSVRVRHPASFCGARYEIEAFY